MCDPVTTAVAVKAMWAATAVSAGSAIYSGYQQKEMADYQAKQANADADAEQQAAVIRGDKIREKAKSYAASTRAALAASGVSIDSISANLINKDIIQRGEEDALIGINDSADAASRLRAQAKMSRTEGRNAVVAGYAKAGSTVLSGYAQSGWYGGSQ
ncbi:hypothetical protein [Zhongshania sp.]|uniref:hypothetical protein n=1 Tax=Zhongshania sp. TaxID=1971902 RepID=UPI001B6BC4B6|nr:hypothetical protein [Zhongshania sp.]MBQ0795760.1 hypothetical protein [Zhongshania sp.]